MRELVELAAARQALEPGRVTRALADTFARWRTANGKAEDATVADLSEDADLRAPGLRAVLFNAPDRGALFASLLALASGRLATCRHVAVVGCTRAEIRGPETTPVQVDGARHQARPAAIR